MNDVSHRALPPRHKHTALHLRAGALVALLWPALAGAQNTFHWTTNYYAVTGATLVEIRQSINQSRPWKGKLEMDGLTEWSIHWRFQVEPSANGCCCRSFTTQVAITNTLPRWRPPATAAATTKKSWEGYIVPLGQHETGHAQIALAAAAEVRKRVGELGEEPDCDGLKKKINDLAHRIVENYRQRDRDYDERTNHGANQGAALPDRVRGGVNPKP